MNYLLYVLLTLALLAIAIAGAVEILSGTQLFLNGPRWVNVWQYGLVLCAGCLLLAFNADDLRATCKDAARLISFPLLLWSMLGVFPVFAALWSTNLGFFLKLVATVGMIAVAIYIWYLIIRYLMVQARPGFFKRRRSGPPSA